MRGKEFPQKKVLSLVLCVAVMLSVMVMGAGAAFSDQDKIENTEAVDMCVALNIIGGYEDGSYHPERNIKRSEICKMICVALNGGEEPTLGTPATPTFSDVRGTTAAWAEKYIESCVAQGIVSGVGGGRFAPASNLTGSQLAKMLLVALGYDSDIEGYTGNAWDMNVNVRATQVGLYKDLEGLDVSAAVTRDDAAQMVWNALQATEVTYKYTLVSENGQLVSKVELVDKTDDQGNKLTMLKDKYNAEVREATLDDFTYNSDKDEWTYAVTSKDTSVPASFTSAQDFTNLYKQNVKVVYSLKASGGVDTFYGMFADESVVLVEGVIGDIDDVTAKDTAITVDDVDYKLDQAVTASTKAYLFHSGEKNLIDLINKSPKMLAYAFKAIDNNDNGKIDFLVVYPFAVAQVTYAGTKSFTVDYLQESVLFEGSNSSYKFEDVATYSDLAEDDFVVYTPAKYSATGEDTFTKVETVLAGDVTATRDGEASIDGTWYNLIGDVNVTAGGTVKDAPVVNGYIFAADATKAVDVSDYAVVIKTEKGTYSNTAQLLFTDGTKKIVDTDKYYNYKGNMVTFEVNSDDEYELTSVIKTSPPTGSGFDIWATPGDSKFQANDLDNGKVKYINGYNIADDAVIFMKDANDYKVITGAALKNTKVNQTKDKVYLAYANENTNGFDTVQLAFIATADEAVSADHSYGYVTSKPAQVENSDGKLVYQYEIWTGDETVTLTTKAGIANDSSVKKGVVISYSVNNAGEIDTVNVLNSNFKAITAYDGTYLKVYNDVDRYEITDDTTVIYIDADAQEGTEGGAIKVASKNASGTYYNNVVFVNDGNDVDLLVVDVNNDIENKM